MKDYSSKPYAEWIDKSIRQLFDLDPDAIYIGVIKDGEVGSLIWKIGKDERSMLIQEILALGVFEVIANSKDKITDMLIETLREKMGDEDEEEEWDLDEEEEDE